MAFTTLPPPAEGLDPSLLGFEIRAHRAIVSHDECDDMTSWCARLYVPGWLSNELWPDKFPEDEDSNQDSPAEGEPSHIEDHIVATTRVCTLNLYRKTRLSDTLDCNSADLAEFMRLVEGDGLRDGLEDSIEGFGMQLVILDRVTVSPLWRGLRLGPLIAALALDTIGGDARLFACHPAAFEYKRGTSERETGDQRLVKMWTKFGFTIPHGHLLLADPAVTDWSAVVRELCGEG